MNAMTKTEQRPVRERAEANRAFLSSRVNITETKEGYLLEAEMPGVNKEGLEVLLEGNELTLIGRRPSELLNAEPVYRESIVRYFRRVFVLDPTIDTAKIDAKMENGILKLHLPKTEKVKPRKISVGD
jgi:HSP20 family protein